ncbi:MAG TPA: hypothetical protein VEL07_13525 [Planctomycetota bacterium]|nr:hypothetical protein [Planctomycetota bacterium]
MTIATDAHRRGTIVIVVAGLVAVLATMALAFLMRMRGSAEDMQHALRVGQAKIMLVAACSYVQEASRIGWDDPATAEHEECFGWIDVRDDTPGPKPVADHAVGSTGDATRWPIGTFRRCPMHALERPPFATRLTVAYNPIRTPFSSPAADEGDPAYGRALLTAPDPQPVVDNGWPGVVSDAAWAAYAEGDQRPRPESMGRSWFRVYRQAPARFVVTCGAGATLGFRSWQEVVDEGRQDVFANDESVFRSLLAQECRLWYLIEWTGSVALPDMHILDNDLITQVDNFQWGCTNSSQKLGIGWDRTHGHGRNMGGTIRWVQRLREEPTFW